MTQHGHPTYYATNEGGDLHVDVHASNSREAAPQIGDSFNFGLRLLDSDHPYRVIMRGHGDQYPSVEAYQYVDGKTFTMGQYNQASSPLFLASPPLPGRRYAYDPTGESTSPQSRPYHRGVWVRAARVLQVVELIGALLGAVAGLVAVGLAAASLYIGQAPVTCGNIVGTCQVSNDSPALGTVAFAALALVPLGIGVGGVTHSLGPSERPPYVLIFATLGMLTVAIASLAIGGGIFAPSGAGGLLASAVAILRGYVGSSDSDHNLHGSGPTG